MSNPVLIFGRIPLPAEPTPAQLASGRYGKRRIAWKGLTLRIENEAGSFRRGRKPDGSEWCSFMAFAYGEVARTEGTDGDPVDVFLGPQMEEAPLVYVIHQRRVGDWEAYDEDKCMLGFMSWDDARDAFLACYDDPRFLGEPAQFTVMPVADFVAKAKATKDSPGMVKALLVKSDQPGLFDAIVPVKATVTKDGVQRAAHTAHRRKRATPPKPPVAILPANPAPTAQRSPIARIAGLRDRAHAHGLNTLTDAEALELILSRSMPYDEAGEWAPALIQRFGSYGAAVSAPLADMMTVRLADGRKMDPDAAADLKLIHEGAVRVAREELKPRKNISGWSELNAYLKTSLQHEPREHFRVLLLDNRNQLILDKELSEGTVDHTAVYPREIMRLGLEVSAKSMILVHNHPSGDPTPSRPDIDMTRQVVEAAKAVGFAVHDHIIVGKGKVSSFRAMGLM